MFVTTAGRTNQEMIEKARKMAGNLDVDYIPRNKKSIPYLQKQANSECVVVGKERLELFGKGESQPFFFIQIQQCFESKD